MGDEITYRNNQCETWCNRHEESNFMSLLKEMVWIPVILNRYKVYVLMA